MLTVIAIGIVIIIIYLSMLDKDIMKHLELKNYFAEQEIKNLQNEVKQNIEDRTEAETRNQIMLDSCNESIKRGNWYYNEIVRLKTIIIDFERETGKRKEDYQSYGGIHYDTGKYENGYELNPTHYLLSNRQRLVRKDKEREAEEIMQEEKEKKENSEMTVNKFTLMRIYFQSQNVYDASPRNGVLDIKKALEKNSSIIAEICYDQIDLAYKNKLQIMGSKNK